MEGNTREEELESLKAIYDTDGFEIFGTSAFSLKLNTFKKQQLKIYVELPKGYPGREKPIFKIKPELPHDISQELSQSITPVLETSEVCLFPLIEAIRSFLENRSENVGFESVEATGSYGRDNAESLASIEVFSGGKHGMLNSPVSPR